MKQLIDVLMLFASIFTLAYIGTTLFYDIVHYIDRRRF